MDTGKFTAKKRKSYHQNKAKTIALSHDKEEEENR